MPWFGDAAESAEGSHGVQETLEENVAAASDRMRNHPRISSSSSRSLVGVLLARG